MLLTIQIMIVRKKTVMSVGGGAAFQTKENFVLIATSHVIVKNVSSITKVTQLEQNQNVAKEKNA